MAENRRGVINVANRWSNLKLKGQSLVEYGLILVLIAAVAAVMLTLFGAKTNNMFSQAYSAIPNP